MKITQTPNSQEVNEFMLNLEHPLKAEMEWIRAIIMNANPKIAEQVKWAAPSFFCMGGGDQGGMATFNPRAKQHVHLVFHNGIILEDKSGLLEGDYKDRRMAYFYNMNDVKSKKEALESVVNTWVRLVENQK